MIPKKDVPYVPRPQKREVADTELLVNTPKAHEETQPKLEKIPQYVKVPQYNDSYDSLGTKGGWRYVSDDFAQGTVTTVAGSAVTSAVSLSTPASMSRKFKLLQWPGAPLLYLAVRFFSFGPSTASFTILGEINALFIDQYGNTLPLGILSNSEFYTLSEHSILPTPITDPAVTAVGTLSFTLNSGATVGNYAWQLGFSYAYMMPAKKGFTWEILHGYGLF
jgi:hypothetical protein